MELGQYWLASTSAVGLANPNQLLRGYPPVQGTHESLQTSLIPPNIGLVGLNTVVAIGVSIVELPLIVVAMFSGGFLFF